MKFCSTVDRRGPPQIQEPGVQRQQHGRLKGGQRVADFGGHFSASLSQHEALGVAAGVAEMRPGPVEGDRVLRQRQFRDWFKRICLGFSTTYADYRRDQTRGATHEHDAGPDLLKPLEKPLRGWLLSIEHRSGPIPEEYRNGRVANEEYHPTRPGQRSTERSV